MKKPKIIQRYCPKCKTKTEHKVSEVSGGGGTKGSLKRGSLQRAKKRGLNRGMGNQGRRSRPAVSKYKRKTKSTKKTNVKYTCSKCKKATMNKKGTRTKKLIIE